MTYRIPLIFLLLMIPSRSISQWTWQHPLPLGNKLYVVRFVGEEVGWISSSAGTLLKTTDGGDTWVVVSVPERTYGQALFFYDRSVGWVGGQTPSGGPSLLLGTVDGGVSWTTQLTLDYGDFRTITFSDRNHGWASGQGGRIFHTIDGGQTWTLQANQSLRMISALTFVDSLNGWGAQEYYRIRTTDGGENWFTDTLDYPLDDIFFLDSLHGWESGSHGIDYTSDGGQSWYGTLNTSQVEWHDLFVLDSLQLWAAGWDDFKYEGVIVRSVDGGRSWQFQVTPTTKVLNSITFRDSLNGVAAGDVGTLLRTTDGGIVWQDVKKSVSDQPLFGISFTDLLHGWVAGWNGTVLKTTNGGVDWDSVHSGTTERLFDLAFVDLQSGWAVGTNGTILHTTDGGITWGQQSSGVISRLLEIDMSQYPQGWIVGGEPFQAGKLLRTIDGGSSWQEVTTILFPSSARRVKFTSSNVGWIMAGDLLAGSVQALYRTRDGGFSWDTVLSNSVDTAFSSMYFVDDSLGWVSTYASTMYATIDGGETWTMIPAPTTFQSLSFTDGLQGWAGAISGEIYRTADGGQTWGPQHSPMSSPVNQLMMYNCSEGWAVGSFGAIVHTANGGVSDARDQESDTDVPEIVTLLQNYPNPFNSVTTLRFILRKRATTVVLRITDLLGRNIVTHSIATPEPGEHAVAWDGHTYAGQEVSSGVYIYQIYVDGLSSFGRMILMK